MKKVYLVLQNGAVFEGEQIGAEREETGEVVFTTGMTGYLETLTDPSYAGQIITQTFPLIGNYGVIEEDFEGGVYAKGYIVRELCRHPSNFRSAYDLDRFLKDRGIPGIAGIDTRALTRMLREEGVMNGRICMTLPAPGRADPEAAGPAEDAYADRNAESAEAELKAGTPDPVTTVEQRGMETLLQEIAAYRVTGVVDEAGRLEAETFPAVLPDNEQTGLSGKPEAVPSDQAPGTGTDMNQACITCSTGRADSTGTADGTGLQVRPFRVVLVDYGAKRNIIRSLQRRGCAVTAVPHTQTAEEILGLHPDGVMLSNGPGDPAENVFCIEQVRKLLGKVPVFGICLGHQITALAMGGKTVKLKYGHHGANQPVREADGSRTFITSQNHNYAVVSESLKGVGRELFINANDLSCEGMEYPDRQCFTVQFHPEACGGPHDTEFLFDRFLAMMEKHRRPMSNSLPLDQQARTATCPAATRTPDKEGEYARKHSIDRKEDAHA